MGVRYKINPNPIGQGAFATVYEAHDENGLKYAVKKIKLASLQKDRIDKFMLELEISEKLSHPNIVKCHEVFKTATSWYIISEYCDSGTFIDLIKELIYVNDYDLKYNIIRKYLSQLMYAIKYLRDNNIIHRDLKPANILLKGINDPIVKLADFGFARYYNSLNINNDANNDTNNDANNDTNNKTNASEMLNITVCGTPLYMAPELLISKRYDMKADLWSFGIIMYELMYGKNPYIYPQLTADILVNLVANKKLTFDEKYPDCAIDLIKRLLQINPEDRITWDEFFIHPFFISNDITSSFIKLNDMKLDDDNNDNNDNDDNVDDIIDDLDDDINTSVISTLTDMITKPLTTTVTKPIPIRKANKIPNPNNYSDEDDDKYVIVSSDEYDESYNPNSFNGSPYYGKSKYGSSKYGSYGSYGSYNSITGSVIRIVSSPITYLLNSINRNHSNNTS